MKAEITEDVRKSNLSRKRRSSMKNRGRLVEILRRAENGPLIDEKDFEAKLIASKVKELLKKYEIKYDPAYVIPDDDAMADRVFEAAMDFAVEVGMFCQNTSRRITWTREEYENGLRSCPGSATMGSGSDAITIHSRMPEDSTPPAFAGGPFGVPVPEDLFVPVMLSYAQESVIDIFENPTLMSVHGEPIKADSPWEVLAGWREAELARDVARLAGRPGMPIGGIEVSPTALGQIAAASYGGMRPSDWFHVSAPSEFKTNYDLLSSVAHITRISGHMEAYLNIIYGGYFGGADGVAIGLAAGLIVVNQNYMGTTISVSSAHPFIKSDATPESLWAQSLAYQAVSRNTDMLIAALSKPASGPGTKTLFYENAAFVLAGVVSGMSLPEASMTAGGTHPLHCSGLESKLAGEVAKASAGMTREQANQIVLELTKRYMPVLKDEPIGKPFSEVYDIGSVRPTPEWLALYAEVKDELAELGVPFKRLRE
jgi:methylamine--corrinoid protein Co-methyltransferase